ncbi:MAG: anhydro-N-acetylmuramic acid kinase [Rhodospirillales bacterium]
MTTSGVLTTIGLMSGTSMDGVDAAVIHTDGERVFGFGPTFSIAYEDEFRGKLRSALGLDPIGEPDSGALALELTHHHASAVHRLLAENGLNAGEIDVIGFHGHTVLHQPDLGLTCQIGNGGLLAQETGIPVINDFRSQDIACGGEGAPLAPVFHAALAHDLEKPLAVLNIGGVANVTWISPDGGLIAFDTGPGNALIDDWVRKKQGQRMDKNGQLAHAGVVDEEALSRLLDHPFFSEPYPKSLDRDKFEVAAVQHLSVADGAATLTAFTAGAVEKAAHLLPSLPNRWLVTGGGRHNPALMAALRSQLLQPVEPVEIVGWQGDALEAQAFGFLAARSLKGLPLSLPSTTGVTKPMTGGTLHKP